MKQAFVIGHPIAHSRSPLIHRYWLEKHGLSGTYDRHDVTPEKLPPFFDSIRTGEFVGGNVTIPHKEAVIALCDDITDTARQIGAANTIFVSGNRIVGDNSDAYGFLANLDDKAPGWDENLEIVTILGAGGASRALIHGLKSRTGATIHLANRTLQRAEQLAAEFGPQAKPLAQSDLAQVLARTSLLINATSIGMHEERHQGLDLSLLPQNAIVTDIVYTPLETPLLADARKAGLRAIDGLGMLLHQAVPGFERWFRIRPEVDADLRQLIEADLFGGEKS
ncbi:MAG: shikimate dehydrogenase [Hyphomicrobiaceae bacterium]|nr:shikimate dehydrogenase [Hyphomicrobiaceae bacterium]MCC0024276.1 shikimate dehydrogenase [Hyphomicrobiaceae bacterium]